MSPSNPGKTRPISGQRLFLVGLSMGLLVLSTIIAAWIVDQTERARARLEFDKQTRSALHGIESNLSVYVEIVQSIASLYAANEDVDRRAFNAFVSRDLRANAGIQALEWIPRVPQDERATYEAAARQDGFEEFQFKKWTPQSQQTWSTLPSDWADEYFPVYFMQPFESNSPALGIDLASNPTRHAALDRARDTGMPVATAKITLAQDTGQQAGFLLFIPVYANGHSPTTVAERRINLKGFALGVFRVGDIVDGALDQHDIEDIELEIRDESDAGEVLYRKLLSQTGFVDQPLQTAYYSTIGGRQWQFQFTATPEYVSAHSGRQSWLIVVGGLLVVGLLGLILNMIINRAAAVEALVKKRTAELEAVNASLVHSESQLAEQAQKLTTSNNELQQFAYVASHDLQEPLRQVSSFCQLLQQEHAESLDEEAKVYINYAVDGSHRMRKLITDLLSFSRINADERLAKPVPATSAYEVAIANLGTAIQENDAAISCTTLPTVMADESQLAQLFQNLIGNALKYRHPDRAPKIEVSAQRADDQWIFAVTDNGIGIGEAYYARVFEVFKRLHTKQDYSGTGIGLAICKKIVERWGQRIWVESSEGKGSTFLFTLGAADAES